MIQYSETLAMESISRGVLDTPHARGMTAGYAIDAVVKIDQAGQASFNPNRCAALPPRMAIFCLSVSVVVANTWSTGCSSQGIG